MKKLDLVKYIALGAKTLSELQKGRFDSVQQKSILRKAAQEVAGLSYNKALNFSVNLVLPREGELEKVANRLKASELEAIARHFDSEILRVKAYIAEKENEEVAATEEDDVDNEVLQSEIAQEQAAKFEEEYLQVSLSDTLTINKVVHQCVQVTIFNSETPYGETVDIVPGAKITPQYILDDIMHKHAKLYQLSAKTFKLVYSPYCIWYVSIS